MFSDRSQKKDQDKDELIQELYRQIDQGKVDLAWLKKSGTHKEKLLLIDRTKREISISHQAELWEISRSSFSYEPVVDEYNLLLKRLIDAQYMRAPFYGSRKMTEHLKRNSHDMKWSRYVLTWMTSATLEMGFCLAALEMALPVDKPEIFNTDPGNPVYQHGFYGHAQGKRHSHQHGRPGRDLDNIFTERLWRSLKYENIHLLDYASVPEGRQGIDRYCGFYNNERPHQFSKSELILIKDHNDGVIHSPPPALLHKGCGGRAVDNSYSDDHDHARQI